MMPNALQEFHQAVDEERYRDAREILLTGDIEPEAREKWLMWLDALHRDEWRLAGVLPEKKHLEAASPDTRRLVAGLAGLFLAGVVTAVVCTLLFTVPNVIFQVGGLLLVLVSGVWGWNRLMAAELRAVMPVAVLLLGGYILSSGAPLYYYFEPQWNYTLAAFALAFPGTGLAGYALAEGLAARSPR